VARGAREPRGRRVIAQLLVAFAIALGGERAGAQQAPAAAPAKPDAPRAVRLQEIPDQLEHDEAELERIERRIAATADLEAVQASLVEVLADVEAHQGEDLAQIERARTGRALDAVASAWVQRRTQISGIEQTLFAASSVLARELAELLELRGRWEATRGAIAATGGSEILLSRVSETLARIDRMRARVEEHIRPIVDLEGRLAAAKEHTSRVEQGVVDARQRLRMDLLRIDSPPLWDVPAAIEGGYRATFDEKLRSAAALMDLYARQNAARLAWFGALGGMFLVALVFLRRSVAGWAQEDPDFARVAGILARPLSGGALIVLMAGMLVVFRDLPVLAKGSVAIALFWPMRRLLAVGILPGLQASLHGIAVWFIADILRTLLLPDGSLASRALLFGEAAGAIGFIRWLRRPERLVHLGEAGMMLRAVGVALRFALPLLALSMVANLVGNVSLAELVEQGILLALYLTYFVHASLGVLKAAFGTFLRTRTAQHSRIVRYHRPLLMEHGERFLQIVSTVLWIAVTARVFFVEDLVYGAISSVFTTRFPIGELDVSIGDIALFLLMIWLSLLLARFLRFALEEDVLARTRLPRGVPFAISTIASYTVVVIGVLVAAAAAGVDIGRFSLVAGALGVGIGIGLQNVVNNFVSGLILLFERPIQLGDTVEVGTVTGTVRRIGMRSSTVRTYDGAEVVVPNASFISNQFINWTLSDRNRRIRLPIGVAYGTDPERVIDLLVGAAKGIAAIREHPAPEAFFMGFGDSALNFELRVWASSFEEALGVQSQLSVAVNAALREAGIESPFPQRDLHLRSVPPAVREDR